MGTSRNILGLEQSGCEFGMLPLSDLRINHCRAMQATQAHNRPLVKCTASMKPFLEMEVSNLIVNLGGRLLLHEDMQICNF
jgi:hypothetical protein